MKRVVSLVCVAALLFSVLCLAGCGIDGTYKMTQVIAADGTSSDWSKESTLTIKGKTATSTNLMGYGETITYEVDTEKKELSAGETKWSYTIDGKQLKMVAANNVTLILEKQ